MIVSWLGLLFFLRRLFYGAPPPRLLAARFSPLLNASLSPQPPAASHGHSQNTISPSIRTIVKTHDFGLRVDAAGRLQLPRPSWPSLHPIRPYPVPTARRFFFPDFAYQFAPGSVLSDSCANRPPARPGMACQHHRDHRNEVRLPSSMGSGSWHACGNAGLPISSPLPITRLAPARHFGQARGSLAAADGKGLRCRLPPTLPLVL